MKPQTAPPPLRVNLSEIFRSIQGEGSRMGRPSVFVRVSGCNLRCQWAAADTGQRVICDTDYASFRPERRVVGVDEVVRQVQELLRPGDDLVITGGEPMLFPHFVAKLCDVFAQDHFLTIETNGTKPLTIVSDTLMYSVSPKLASSQSGSCLDQVAQHVREAGAAIQLKFVCAHPKDLDDIDPWVRSLQRPASVYLMPLGSDEPSIAASATWVAEAALERGYSYSDRLHVRLWGGRRGV